jgi:predicted MFS family arabinose efflux permease
VEIIRLPAARLLYMAVAVEGLFTFGLFPYVAALMAGWGIGGPVQAGLALGAFGAAGVAYTFVARPLLTRLGVPMMLRLAGLLTGLGFAAIAVTGWIAGAGGSPGLWSVVAGMFAIGMGFFGMHNSIQNRVTEVAPKARGSAVALHAFSFFTGQSLGPVLFGTALAVLGAGPALLTCGAGMLALGLVLSRKFSRRQQAV